MQSNVIVYQLKTEVWWCKWAGSAEQLRYPDANVVKSCHFGLTVIILIQTVYINPLYFFEIYTSCNQIFFFLSPFSFWWLTEERLKEQVTPKSYMIMIFFCLPIALYIHVDCFGMSCWVLETSAFFLSEIMELAGPWLVELYQNQKNKQSNKRKHSKNNVSFQKLWTQDNPQTLLWAVSWSNYFLSTKLHLTNVLLLRGKRASATNFPLALLRPIWANTLLYNVWLLFGAEPSSSLCVFFFFWYCWFH